MPTVLVTRDFVAPPTAAEELWYDTGRWPAWVDGLARVVHADESWPQEGAEVRWESHPGGRGEVQERSIAHGAGSGQTSEITDARMRATQAVAFEPLEGGVAVQVTLRYELAQRGPATWLIDLLFIRRALGDSLRRTLDRFGAELAAEPPSLR